MKKEECMGDMGEMTNEEYRVELRRIFAEVDNNRMLRYFYISALEKMEQKNLVDYQVYVPDYGDLIIEMISGIQDEWILKQVCKYIRNMTKEG